MKYKTELDLQVVAESASDDYFALCSGSVPSTVLREEKNSKTSRFLCTGNTVFALRGSSQDYVALGNGQVPQRLVSWVRLLIGAVNFPENRMLPEEDVLRRYCETLVEKMQSSSDYAPLGVVFADKLLRAGLIGEKQAYRFADLLRTRLNKERNPGELEQVTDQASYQQLLKVPKVRGAALALNRNNELKKESPQFIVDWSSRNPTRPRYRWHLSRY